MPKSIEAFDWSATPLGPMERWSPALRTTYDMLMGTGFAACATWGPEQTLIYNGSYIEFLGERHPGALGRPIDEVWHDVWADIQPLIDRALSGESVYMENLHLVTTRNGDPEDTYWTFSYSPLRDGDRIEGILDIAMETTARVAAERRNALLVAETTHRLKNTMTMVQAIAQQSLRGVADRATLKRFDQRLQALASAHDVLHQEHWESADLLALVDSTLRKVVDPARYDVSGPTLEVSARVAQTLCLVMHELATNAIKHGAWSGAEGHVDIAWGLDKGIVKLEWREVGGPIVVAGKTKGFGSKLISSGLAGTGEVETRFDPDGLKVTFTATAASLLER